MGSVSLWRPFQASFHASTPGQDSGRRYIARPPHGALAASWKWQRGLERTPPSRIVTTHAPGLIFWIPDERERRHPASQRSPSLSVSDSPLVKVPRRSSRVQMPSNRSRHHLPALVNYGHFVPLTEPQNNKKANSSKRSVKTNIKMSEDRRRLSNSSPPGSSSEERGRLLPRSGPRRSHVVIAA